MECQNFSACVRKKLSQERACYASVMRSNSKQSIHAAFDRLRREEQLIAARGKTEKGLDNHTQDKIKCSGAVEIVEIFMVGVTYGWKELMEGIFILYENEMLVHRTSFRSTTR